MSATRFATATKCPCCGKVIDAATPAFKERKMPGPGDFTVCIDCAAILVFTDARGNMRLATRDEENLFLEDWRNRALLRRLQHLKKQRDAVEGLCDQVMHSKIPHEERR